eukprot:36170-Chlamydomonas_euryale.AAC.3
MVVVVVGSDAVARVGGGEKRASLPHSCMRPFVLGRLVDAVLVHATLGAFPPPFHVAPCARPCRRPMRPPLLPHAPACTAPCARPCRPMRPSMPPHAPVRAVPCARPGKAKSSRSKLQSQWPTRYY